MRVYFAFAVLPLLLSGCVNDGPRMMTPAERFADATSRCEMMGVKRGPGYQNCIISMENQTMSQTMMEQNQAALDHQRRAQSLQAASMMIDGMTPRPLSPPPTTTTCRPIGNGQVNCTSW